jgi:hypothetical protein
MMERTAKALYDKINGRKRTIHRLLFPFLKNKSWRCIAFSGILLKYLSKSKTKETNKQKKAA